MKSYILRFQNTQREIELIMKENFPVEWKTTEKKRKWLASWVKGSELSSGQNLLTTIDIPRTPWLTSWSTLVCLLFGGIDTLKPLFVLILVGTHKKIIQGAENTEECAFHTLGWTKKQKKLSIHPDLFIWLIWYIARKKYQ